MDGRIVEGLLRARVFGDPDTVMSADPDADASRLIAEIERLAAPADLGERAAAARRVIAIGVGSGRDDLELLGRTRLMDVLAITGARGALLDELAACTRAADRLGGGAADAAELLLAAQALIDGRFAVSADHIARVERRAAPGSDAAFLVPVLGFALARLTGDGLAEFPARVESLIAGLPVSARGWLAAAHMAVGDRRAAAAQWRLVRDAAAVLPETATEFLVAGVGNAALAAWLDDTVTATTLLDVLTPHAHLHVMGSAAGPYEGPVHLALGTLHAALGRPAEAHAHLDAALEQCRSIGAVPHQAVVRRRLALLERPGSRTRREHVAAAREIAQRLGMAPLLSSLREFGEDGTLTPREREVAARVAAGEANAAIARALFLSERTVENHVRNALMKVGGSSRTSLAVWHLEHDRHRTG